MRPMSFESGTPRMAKDGFMHAALSPFRLSSRAFQSALLSAVLIRILQKDQKILCPFALMFRGSIAITSTKAPRGLEYLQTPSPQSFHSRSSMMDAGAHTTIFRRSILSLDDAIL